MCRVMLLWLLACAAVLADDRVERALALTRAKQYAQAAAAIEGAAEPAALSQRIAFHRLKAAIASGLNQYAAAADEMERAYALAPDAALLVPLAVAELQAGRKQAAAARLEQARAHADSAVIESLRGDLLEAGGKFVEAAQAYQRAVELAPGEEQPRLNLALELVRHGTFEPAEQVLESGLREFPASVRLRVLLAITYYANERAGDAVAMLLEAARIEPGNPAIYAYLSDFVLQGRREPDPAAAAALCGLARRRPDDAHAAAVCAAVEVRIAHDGGAPIAAQMVERLRRAARDAPADATSRCELGRAYEWLEQWELARGEMQVCAGLQPLPGNYYRLGRVFTKLGRADLAAEQFRLQKQAEERASEALQVRETALERFVVEARRP